MDKFRILFPLMMLSALTAPAQTQVEPFRPGVTAEGVNYFLPKTQLRVVVVARKTVVIPGEFAAYADRYLRLTDVPWEETTEWELQRIELHPYGVPDPDKAFSIRLKTKTSAPLVSLTDDGLLIGVNTRVDPLPEPALPVAEAAPKPLQPRDFMGQDILSAGSTAKMAQLSAEQIYDIRESRNAIFKGEADNTPKDGHQLQLMLDGLDRQEAALTSLFRGQRLSSIEVLTFDFDPAKEPKLLEHPQLLCRFSRRLGLVDADDLSGEPIWLTVKSLHNLPELAPDAEVQKRKVRVEQGLYVNQPLRTRITVSTASNTLLTDDIPIAQLGTTEVLSSVLFNKQMDTQITLYQHTGSVSSISGH